MTLAIVLISIGGIIILAAVAYAMYKIFIEGDGAGSGPKSGGRGYARMGETRDAEYGGEYRPPELGAGVGAGAAGLAPVHPSADDFVLLKVLGKGAFAKVFQVRLRQTNQLFAMKVLSKADIINRSEVAHTLAERNILLKMKHPFLVHMSYSFQSPTKLYFVLEYVPGGELYALIQKEGRFSVDRARLYAAELVLGLEHLHANGIIYRDLKPENILLDSEGHIRITDFGLSKEDLGPSGTTRTLCGTPEYLAPEVLRGLPYNRAVDWWSLGTVLFEMLVGLPPFYEKNDKTRMFKRILRGKLKIPEILSDPDAIDIVSRLLSVDPDARLGGGPRDAAEIKEHPFFAEIDWQAVYAKECQPDYVPRLRRPTDASHFVREFTQMPVQDVVNEPDPTLVGDSMMQNAFDGFTFTSPSMLADSSDMPLADLDANPSRSPSRSPPPSPSPSPPHSHDSAASVGE